MAFISEEAKAQFADPEWGGQQLRRVAILEGLTDEELRELYAKGETRIVESKANVVIEGEQSRGLFVLLKGAVSIYKRDDSTGHLLRLAILESGAIFGEMSLFDDTARSATVAAESQCCLFELKFQVFDEYLQQKGPDIQARFFRKCAEDLAARFRTQNNDYITAQKLLWQYALRKKNHEEEPTES